MVMQYSSFLTSAPFQITGPDGTVFFAHAAVIAGHSRVLERDVNGGMQESEARAISIVDVDGDFGDGTVMRFIEYAYTGDYTVPEPVTGETDLNHNTQSSVVAAWTRNSHITNLDEPNVPNVPVDAENGMVNGTGQVIEESGSVLPVDDIVAWSRFSKKRKNSKSKKMTTIDYWTGDKPCETDGSSVGFLTKRKQQMWSDFHEKTKTTWNWVPRKPKPTAEAGDEDDYTIDLVCHAQLYVFSDRYGCGDLGQLALQRLRLTLSKYHPSNGMVPVVKLAAYTYAHTHEYDKGQDQLRTLIVEYLVCHVEWFMKSSEFRLLLREAGAFADDLLVKTMQRLE